MKIGVFLAGLVLSIQCALAQAPQAPGALEVLTRPSVTFLGQQDGEFERAAKAALVKVLADSKGVREAFLVRVRYGNGEEGVALSLVDETPVPLPVIDAIQKEFGRIAGRGVSMDIIFLTPLQRAQVHAVAVPFYVAPAP